MTNRYLDGTYALTVNNAPSIAALARVRPMSADLARNIIGACIGTLGDDSDTKRQLTNMRDTIERKKLDVLPDGAANALCKAVDCVGDDAAPAVAASADDEDDQESLIVDYGWHPEAETNVLDADGDFDFDGNDDNYEVAGLAWNDAPIVEQRWDERPIVADQVVGVAVLEWDNHNTYQPGEIVYFGQAHWRALREVDPPLVPAFMDGEVPGQSDAWRQISAAEVYKGNVVGNYGEDDDDEFDTEEGEYDVLIGMVDIGQAQLKMNGLKPVTVGIAKSLIHGGLQVMAVANLTAAQHSLPMQTNRDEVVGHLQWHQNKLAGLKDDKAVYDSGDDAKKWAMQAFIEANSVEEGAAYLDEAWNQMWAEIAKQLSELPKKIVQTLAQLPGKAFEAATGIPSWAFYVGAAVLVGGLVYGAYKILAGPVGAAAVGAYIGRR